jgi:serine/threonine protein kinase
MLVFAFHDMRLKHLQWLDREADSDHRSKVIRFMVDLALQSKQLPASLFVSDVHVPRRDIVESGGCSDIFQGQYRGEKVAVKRLRIRGQAQALQMVHEVGVLLLRWVLSVTLMSPQSFCKESLVWRQLTGHPNVLPFYGVDKETFKDHVALVSPWMSRGSLKQYLADREIHPPLHVMKTVRS